MSIISNIFKIPLHFIQIFTGAKSFEKNLLLGNKFLNHKGLHIWRIAITQKLAKKRRSSLSYLVSKEEREAYESNGFVRIENFLDTETFTSLLEEINNRDFERFDMTQGSTITRRSMIDEVDIEFSPVLKKVKNDKHMQNLVQYVASYLGQPLITLQTVLAKTKSDSNLNGDPQTQIHSDTFHPTAKAWLFLSDVEESDGPFSYVIGSHKVTKQRYVWEKEISTSLDKIENVYARRGSLRVSIEQLSTLGYPAPTPMTVKANTLIVADTHGFHARCPSEKATVRIEIYCSLRRNPFFPFVATWIGGFHVASLPFIKKRLNRNIINGLETLKKLGIRGNPWKSIGYGKANEWTIDNSFKQD